MVHSKSLKPNDANFVNLSDSTAIPEGNTYAVAAPSVGGSSSSSSSAQQLAYQTSPSERGLSKSMPPSAEQQQTLLPKRNHCACSNERKFDDYWTLDLIEGFMSEIGEAVDELRELQHEVLENMKKPMNDDDCDVLVRVAKVIDKYLEKPKNEKDDVLKKVAMVMDEKQEERLQKLVAEQQAAMAKIAADSAKDAKYESMT